MRIDYQTSFYQSMRLLKVISLMILSLSLVQTGPLSAVIDKGHEISGINYRLPNDVIPTAYKIKIIPYSMEFSSSFDGESEIKIEVLATTRKVTLHAKNLVIKNAFIMSNERVKYESLNHTINDITDFLTINFGIDLETHRKYTLFLEYRGVFNDTTYSFFRSSYLNAAREIVWYAATHFEPIGARQAFPCFDEPARKATFDISIKHSNKYHALSNMHILKKELAPDDSEQIWTTFATTPKMSTYLVAFVISDFVKLENEAHDFRIWAREEVIQNGEYVLDIGPKILKSIEEYTGISRNSTQFIKMDNVVIPKLKARAMENWGLVIYEEKNLLVEKGVTSVEDQEFVTIAVAHEFVHQWFGNLVTPKSWHYGWLKEGFATYFQNFFADKVEPTWQLNDLFIVDYLQTRAFEDDSNANKSVSMNHQVETQAEIKEKIIDPSTFFKAGSVIRMISHILPETKFRNALRRYLKKMSYKAATPNDLFVELSAEYRESGLEQAELREAFDNWVDTPGFPVITVTRDYASKTAVVTQERFLINDNSNHGERYWIPINFAQNKSDFYDTKPSHWFNPNDKSITIRGLESNQWVIFNNQRFGYYRVNYDEENWELIISVLNSDQYENIHVLNRGQLLDDAFKLAETSRLSWSIPLRLASYLKREKNYIPWKSASSGLLLMYRKCGRSKICDFYKDYTLDLMENFENTLGYEVFPEDDHLMKHLKNLMESLGCNLHSKYCQSYAYSKIEKWITNSTKHPYPKRYFCDGIRGVNQSIWNGLFDIYLESKETILKRSLTCSSNEKILEGYLNLAVNASMPFDLRSDIISDILKLNRYGLDVALNFIIHNYPKIVAVTSENESEDMQLLISNVRYYLYTPKQIEKWDTFMKANENRTEGVI